MQRTWHLVTHVGAAVLLAVSTLAAADERMTFDADIAARVKSALAADHALYARHIKVSVDNGVVYLKGFVQSEDDLQLAKKDAQAVQGVDSVRNELQLKQPQSNGPH